MIFTAHYFYLYILFQIFDVLDTVPDRNNRRAAVHVPRSRRDRGETIIYDFYAERVECSFQLLLLPCVLHVLVYPHLSVPIRAHVGAEKENARQRRKENQIIIIVYLPHLSH